jgi:predicted  nucleic acid-binding Zn-ribbon protein
MFVHWLKTQNKISVTKGNAACLSLLANEFFLPDLAAECAAFSVPVDPISSLSDRVCKLELRVSSVSSPPGRIEEELVSQERGLETLRQEVERQRESFYRKVGRVVSKIDDLRSGVAVVVSRVDALERAFENLRGEVQVVRDSAGGEIGKLKSATTQVRTLVANLRPELEGMKPEVARLKGEIRAVKASADREIGKLKSETESVRTSVASLEGMKPEVNHLKLDLQQLQGRPPPGSQNPSAASKRPAKVWANREIPMKKDKPLDGIISFLTTKHRGNVHEKGIVTITSKSVSSDKPMDAVQRAADMKAVSWFSSEDERFEWICWDFGEMRVQPTGYTLWTQWLRSWVIEGAADGDESWTEIDRQTDNQDFKAKMCRASFTISRPREFRCIRLTQTDKNHFDPVHFGLDSNHPLRNALRVRAVEFFGTLSE